MPDVDLSYAIGLPPKEAMEYFRQKGYVFSWNWHDVWQDAHAKAFTVAKAMKLDLLQDMKKAVDDALANGTTFSKFQDDLIPLLQSKGWWGKVDGAQLGSPHRLNTIFRTNLQSSYMAGRYKQQAENADDRPYWQYIAVMDSRTRPAHSVLNGKVFRFDDPFWNTHYPPNGYNCRCRTRALTEKQVKDRGLTVESGADNMVWEDKPINKNLSRPVAGYRDPKTGKITFTDVGWSSNPGKEFWKPDFAKILERMNPPKTWKYIPGTQGGSNPGGVWMGPDGKKYYGKVYDNADQARQEFLSCRLMQKLNIGAPKVQLKMLEWNGQQRLVILSEWMENAIPLKRLMGSQFTAAAEKQLTKQFLNAAMSNNWDFVGLEFDNLVRVGNKWYMIDAGGSMEFRAMGGSKVFGPIADAFDSMLQPGRNPAQIFNRILDKTLRSDPDEYVNWMKGLTNRQIQNAVKEAGLDAKFAKILIDRRDDVIRRIEAMTSISNDLENIRAFMGDGYQNYLRRYVGGGVLSELEYVITKGYTGNRYYGDINGSLVTNGGERYGRYFSQVPTHQLESIVRQMNRALDKLPKPGQNVVWRGVSLDPAFVRSKFVPGETVSLYGYQSTSLSRPFSGNTQFEIRLTKQQGGMVNVISDFVSENEFLMKPDLNYRVIDIQETQPGFFKIVLEEL